MVRPLAQLALGANQARDSADRLRWGVEVNVEERDDRLAAALRGVGAPGLLAAIAVLFLAPVLGPLRAAVPLLWAWRSRTPLRELGLVRPRSWLATVLLGVGAGVTLKLLMKSLVMPLLGAPPVNAAFHHLQGNTAALPGMMFIVVVGAGLGEELMFRGFLFERLGRLLGHSRRATVAIVVGTSLLFGALHLPEQGVPGAQQATIVGLVMGVLYAGSRQLWLPVVIHAMFDVTAVIIIYLGLETRVAHWFFR